MPNVCRTCLKVDNNEQYTFVSLNSFIPESNSIPIKDKLSACVPQISINIAPDPSICNSCMNALKVTYEFWNVCLQTEEKIRNYMQINGLDSLDLSHLIEFEQTSSMAAKQGEADCELIEVECRSPEMHIEPDLIDIKYMMPELPQDEHSNSEESIKIEDNEVVHGNDDSLQYFQASLTEDYCNQNEEIIEVIIKSETAEENEEQASHVCYKCGHSFITKGSLMRHMSLHSKPKSNWNITAHIRKRNTLPLKRLNEHLSRLNAKEKPHMCHICGKSFLQRTTLTQHMLIHSGEKPYRCEICDKVFNVKNNLQRHMLMHEGGGPKRFKCNICEKSFTRKEHLGKHVISHTDEMPHQCMLCKKLFKYKDSLRGHLKYHNGEKRFRCEICGNGFIRHDNLQVHLRTVHMDEKSFECNTCNKEFLEKCTYEEHIKLHTGRTFYKCKTCNKLCKTKQSLQLHSNTHLTEKPYKCTICDHTFSQKGTLTYHIRTHTGEKPYVCFLCERRFAQKTTLRNHVRRHRTKEGFFVKGKPIEDTSDAKEGADLMP